jgi:hypothetical protein
MVGWRSRRHSHAGGWRAIPVGGTEQDEVPHEAPNATLRVAGCAFLLPCLIFMLVFAAMVGAEWIGRHALVCGAGGLANSLYSGRGSPYSSPLKHTEK